MSLHNIFYFQKANHTEADEEEYNGTIAWLIINIILITVTVFGNLLTISAILCCRKLSSIIANQFVFSLAVSDLFVGLTIPYHMAFYIAQDFGSGKLNCLLRFVLLSFACSSSITNLLVIAADRYVAIVYPLHYNRIVTKKHSLFLVIFAWTLSFTIAAIPLMWNDWQTDLSCEFFNIIPDNYMNFVLCPMFILIWIMMLLLYTRICREAAGHAKRMRTSNSAQNILLLRDSKSFQVILTILGCFTICWLPYVIITIYCRHNRQPKSALYYEIAFNLAVANSGMNPIIYAWKNHNFRDAFLQIIKCKSPNNGNQGSGQYITNHVPNMKSSILNNCATICDKFELRTNNLRERSEIV